MRINRKMFRHTISAMLLFWCAIMAACESSIIEREALLNTNWWRESSNVTSDHCNWTGVACSETGSIIRIDMFNRSIKGKLNQLNLSCFPNLEYLNLGRNYITGNIQLKEHDLPKLHTLDLSWNQLTGILNNLVHLHLHGRLWLCFATFKLF